MFLSVVILGRFTTETPAMALSHHDRHAATTYTTPRDMNPMDYVTGPDIRSTRSVPVLLVQGWGYPRLVDILTGWAMPRQERMPLWPELGHLA